MNTDDHILLSVLIPAYEYAAGVERILVTLSEVKGVEVVIADDSHSDEVEVLQSNFPLGNGIQYVRNSPSLGAARNWNYLLDNAKGTYCILLHHDEYPSTKRFWEKLLYILSLKKYDAVLLNTLLETPQCDFRKSHIPWVFRRAVIGVAPRYIFRRNVIGAPSNIIVRTDIYPRFDVSYQWLIDVELYYRLFKLRLDWYMCTDLSMVSTINRAESITASLSEGIRELHVKEKERLLRTYPELCVWFGANKWMPVRFFESIFWVGFRLVDVTFYKGKKLFRFLKLKAEVFK